MRRRSWMWFVASAVLAVVAGVVVIIILRTVATSGGAAPEVRAQAIVVAVQPLDVNTILRVDMLRVEERQDVPSGVVVDVQDVLGAVTLRPFAAGEPILMQDLRGARGQIGPELPVRLVGDTLAVALPADDILSKWGTVVPGDHVDVLLTLDVLLETPLRPRAGVLYPEIERDQTFDHVSVLVLQNLEVLQIIEEPQEPVQEDEGPPPPRARALVLQITPQDAAVLRYVQTVPEEERTISLALRNPENTTLFDTEAVNINYMLLRYGIDLPEEFE